MSEDLFRSSGRASVSAGFRLFRGLVRLWISVFVGKVRTLEAEGLPETLPALFVVSHRAGFLDAVLSVAALDRQVHCLVDRRLVRGVLRRMLARGLGMIPYEGDGWRHAADAACNVLENLGSVAVFMEPETAERRELSLFARAAGLAVEAEVRNARQLGLMLVPLNFFSLQSGNKASGPLVYVERRIPAQASSHAGESLEEWRHTLSAALEQACRKNVFRLQPQDVRNFLADLEELLLADLEEEFAARPHWKQNVEGFELSGFIAEWVDRLNDLDPGRLVALRESLSKCREARRQALLQQLEVERAGSWVTSAAGRGLAWAETVIGFPAALYGLVNHLPAGLILRAAGLFRKQSGMDRGALWVSRLAVVLLCYAVQIFVCDYFWGRAAAGYYVLSLPITGLYLWRYSLVLRRRTRFAFLHTSAVRNVSRLRDLRRAFVQELNAARDADVGTLELSR